MTPLLMMMKIYITRTTSTCHLIVNLKKLDLLQKSVRKTPFGGDEARNFRGLQQD